ncbi:MAG TPA: hypothetical protein EYO83_09940 [Gemmatimonadetes bacterium]|nr:hypothetical protein [Gemmatimonadota bacterium]
MFLSVIAAEVTAQSPSSPAYPAPSPEGLGLLPGRPRITPTRTDEPLIIDGVLADTVWEHAAHISEFTQQSPLDGEPATEDTDVYIA